MLERLTRKGPNSGSLRMFFHFPMPCLSTPALRAPSSSDVHFCFGFPIFNNTNKTPKRTATATATSFLYTVGATYAGSFIHTYITHIYINKCYRKLHWIHKSLIDSYCTFSFNAAKTEQWMMSNSIVFEIGGFLVQTQIWEFSNAIVKWQRFISARLPAPEECGSLFRSFKQ